MRTDLVERARDGDREAYELLARTAAPGLFTVAGRILRDRDAAEDAVQQTLVTIWQDLGSLRDLDRFDAWSYRILVRQCRAEGRRRRRLGVDFVELTDASATSRDDVERVDVDDQLARAFERLSLDHRTVLVLHHLVGMPLAEIATVLEVPYGTVGSRLHHAMNALRAAIEAGERDRLPGGQPA